MDNLADTEKAQRALIHAVTGKAPDGYQPLDQKLDGPAVRYYGRTVPLALQLARSRDGRLVCTGLLVGWDGTGTEITSRLLSEIRLGGVITDISRLADLANRPGAPQVTVRPKGSSEAYDEEHFRNVADSYAIALLMSPHSPVQWLAQRLNVSISTVQRWVQRCKDKGLI